LIKFDYTNDNATFFVNKEKMPTPIRQGKLPGRQSPSALPSHSFNPKIAGQAIVDGIEYLKSRLEWSGSKVARILHLPANTVNTWLKNGTVPIHSAILQPDVQAVIHLLAIHRSLEAMFENPLHQRAWLQSAHPELGAIPEEMMSRSLDGLIFIRQYLDYVRGRGA
jgi:hypothetical protein